MQHVAYYLQQKNGGKFDTLSIPLFADIHRHYFSQSFCLHACPLFSASILQRQQNNFHWFRHQILFTWNEIASKKMNKQTNSLINTNLYWTFRIQLSLLYIRLSISLALSIHLRQNKANKLIFFISSKACVSLSFDSFFIH